MQKIKQNMEMINPKVTIIVLNWIEWKNTIECLESLYRITYPNYDVIVVDNGSEDESIEKIKEYCKGKVKVDSKFFEYDQGNKPIKIIEGKHGCKHFERSNRRDRGTNFKQS